MGVVRPITPLKRGVDERIAEKVSKVHRHRFPKSFHICNAGESFLSCGHVSLVQ